FDVGASSFDLMNIAVAIEERFNISISNKNLPVIKTVGDIAALLEKKLSETV
ncbi:MAG: acyl carrier protein, partial [Clostridia bacterium]|nr:acyl carrier protein [Clostridia bacterium]